MERQIAAYRKLTQHPAIGARFLGAAHPVGCEKTSTRHAQRAIAGERVVSVVESDQHFRATLQVDRHAAAAYLAALYGLANLGFAVVALPSARPGEGVTENTLDVVSASGRLADTVRRCRADGVYDAHDLDEIEQDANVVLREVLELRADTVAVPRPQMSFGSAQ